MWDRGESGPAAWCAVASVLLASSGAAPWCARARAQARCVVRGEAARVWRVSVTPPEGEPFEVSVRRARVLATLPSSVGADIGLDVDGALVFAGTTRESELRVGVAAVARVASGLLTLRPEDGWTMHDLSTTPDGSVVGTLEEHETTIERVPVPCAALGLDRPKWNDPVAGETLAEWLPRRATLRLHARPGSAAALTLRFASAEAFEMTVSGAQAHTGWVFARHVWSGGSEIHGWVRREDVRRGQADLYAAGGGGGGCGRGYGPDDEYGAAVVRRGAPVFGSPLAPTAWAHVATADSFIVWRPAGSARYALLKTEDLDLSPDCRGEPRAWVELRDVDFGVASVHGTALRETLRLGAPGRAIVFATVAAGGAFERAGIRAGDELRELDCTGRGPIEESSVEQLRDALRRASIVRVRRTRDSDVCALVEPTCDYRAWPERCEAR